jgi:hypothetical protein
MYGFATNKIYLAKRKHEGAIVLTRTTIQVLLSAATRKLLGKEIILLKFKI